MKWRKKITNNKLEDQEIKNFKLVNGEEIFATVISRNEKELILENITSIEIVPDTGQLYMQFWHSFTLENSTSISTKDIVSEVGTPTDNYKYYYRQFVANCLQRRYQAYQSWIEGESQENSEIEDEEDLIDIYDSLKSIN